VIDGSPLLVESLIAHRQSRMASHEQATVHWSRREIFGTFSANRAARIDQEHVARARITQLC